MTAGVDEQHVTQMSQLSSGQPQLGRNLLSARSFNIFTPNATQHTTSKSTHTFTMAFAWKAAGLTYAAIPFRSIPEFSN